MPYECEALCERRTLHCAVPYYNTSEKRTLGCTVCITDLDQVVAASGAGSRELKGQYISEELEHMIQERKQRTAKIGEKHYVQAVQGMGEFCLETICPIISGGDVTGAVLLLEKEEKKNPELDEKMAQGAADFLGRQMG